MDKPRFIQFEQLFPEWSEHPVEKTLTPEQLARQNARRLDAWADEEVE